MPDPTYAAYWHRLGPVACGLLAFWVNDAVAAPSGIMGAMIRRADGGMVRFEDQIRCTTCGRAISWPAPLPEGRMEVDV